MEFCTSYMEFCTNPLCNRKNAQNFMYLDNCIFHRDWKAYHYNLYIINFYSLILSKTIFTPK